MKEVDIFGATDMGLIRTNNEDTFVCESAGAGRYILLAAIDGVGGMEKGEVAAEIARNEIVNAFSEKKIEEGIDPGTALKSAVVRANNLILAKISEDPEAGSMGCVLSAAVIDTKERLLTMVHIGDSRLYVLNNGQLIKLSHDHSFVGALEDDGTLSESEAMNHPRRNEILRALGLKPFGPDDPDAMEVAEYAVMGKSVYMLCSDGLTDLVDSRTILAILSDGSSAENQVKQLISRALSAGGKDNVTVVVAQLNYPETGTNDISKSFGFSNDTELKRKDQSKQKGDATKRESSTTEPARSAGKKHEQKEKIEVRSPKVELPALPDDSKTGESKTKSKIFIVLAFLALFFIGFLLGDFMGGKVVGQQEKTIKAQQDSLKILEDSISTMQEKINVLEGNLNPEDLDAVNRDNVEEKGPDKTQARKAELENQQ